MIKYIKRPSYVVGIMEDGTKFFFDKEDIRFFKGKEIRLDNDGYLLFRKENHNLQRVHREILGLTKHDRVVVDHINRNKRDNRRCNLRVCSNAENTRNHKLSKRNKTGVTGVYKLKNGRYSAAIGVNNKLINLGTFDTIDDATAARKQAERLYHGEFSSKEQVKII